MNFYFGTMRSSGERPWKSQFQWNGSLGLSRDTDFIAYGYKLFKKNVQQLYIPMWIIFWLRPVVAQGHKMWLLTRLVVCPISTREKEMFNIFNSSLWCRGISAALSSVTQCFQNSADNWERSVLTLGSLCLPCCVTLKKSYSFSTQLR